MLCPLFYNLTHTQPLSVQFSHLLLRLSLLGGAVLVAWRKLGFRQQICRFPIITAQKSLLPAGMKYAGAATLPVLLQESLLRVIMRVHALKTVCRALGTAPSSLAAASAAA